MSRYPLKISIVIPTLDRPREIGKAVESIGLQLQKCDELIIIDQSKKHTSKEIVGKILSDAPNVRLKYVHDPNIRGLVAAKSVGVSFSSGDIVCFLDDDIVLETGYFDAVRDSFQQNLSMVGSSGYIINESKNRLYAVIKSLFYRGIFYDPRSLIFSECCKNRHNLIPCRVLSGGVSAWRREVFDVVDFDLRNELHLTEDIDFSTRVFDVFGDKLFVNANAKVNHYHPTVESSSKMNIQKRKIKELIIFYKKRKDFKLALISVIWLLSGLLIESMFMSVARMSFRPLKGFYLGVMDGLRFKLKYNKDF
jgi:glycosyltransferase involved in cell wall biosynthesis